MKIYITAMTESRKEIERSLKGSAEAVVEHIMKLVLMPHHSARNHWKQEIAALLHKVDRLAGSKKYPSAQDIYKWTYGKIRDRVTDTIYMEEMLYGLTTDYNIETDMTPNEFCGLTDSACTQYFKWLSDRLSSIGMIASQRIYDKLDELT